MIDKELVNQIVSEYLEERNFFLVDMNISRDNRIAIEIDSDNPVSLDDCADLSHYIESKLDREEEDYELSISSAGISSAFKIDRQYQKNLGKEVEVLTRDGMKYKGVLQAYDGEKMDLVITQNVKLEGAKRKTEVEEIISIEKKNIKSTKLIIRFK